MENIKERIRTIAKEQGYSLTELEKAAGLGNGVIGGWDRSSPRLDKFIAVADTLGVTVDELLGIKKEPAESGLDEQIVRMLRDLPEDKIQRVRDFLAGISGK